MSIQQLQAVEYAFYVCFTAIVMFIHHTTDLLLLLTHFWFLSDVDSVLLPKLSSVIGACVNVAML